MSEKTPIVAEPESERVSISGIMSVGMLKNVKTGASAVPIHSKTPDALSIEIPTIIATKYGIILIATLNPSFAPSVKTS